MPQQARAPGDSLSTHYAKWAHRLAFEDIPADVVRDVGFRILDTLGIQIGSTRLKSTRAALDTVSAWAGAGQARVPGVDRQFPVASAALAGGIMGHSFDFDDVHFKSLMHPTCVMVPTALAAGQSTDCSGRDLVTAIVAGYEVAIRLGIAKPGAFHSTGLHTTSVMGVFGATITTSVLRKLPVDAMCNALGLAGSASGGLLQSLVDGTDAKLFNAGWAAHGGVVCAELAANGFTAPRDILEGHFGLFPAFLRTRDWDVWAPANDLGRAWVSRDLQYKRYPNCGHLESFVDAMKLLRQKHPFALEDVAAVTCLVNETQRPVVAEPRDEKLNPRSVYGSRFSLPYTIAATLIFGDVTNETYSEENLGRRDILDLAARVQHASTSDPQFQALRPAIVIVKTKDGRTLAAPGASDVMPTSATEQQVEAKFLANCRGLLAPQTADRIIEMCRNIANLRRLSDLLSLTNPSPSAKVA